jgi:hypothetical protein
MNGGCQKHPKYAGRKQPTNNCTVCWTIWKEQNPVARISRNLIASAREIVPSPEIVLPRFEQGDGDEERFVLLLSDLQVGVTSPTFNFNVFHQRMETLARGVTKVTLLHRKAHPVNILHVFMLGDNIQNERIGYVVDLDHLEGVLSIQLFQHCIPALMAFFDEMLTLFTEIHVSCVRGNHGSMGRFNAADSTNFDDVAYYFLQAFFRGNPRIHFDISDKFWNTVDIFKKRFVLVHGDKIPSTWSIPFYGITTRSMRWQGSIGDYEYLCLGHFHTYNVLEVSGRTVFMNGTFLSDDEWTIRTLGWTSSVCQMLLGIHPKRGVSFVRRIDLG